MREGKFHQKNASEEGEGHKGRKGAILPLGKRNRVIKRKKNERRLREGEGSPRVTGEKAGQNKEKLPAWEKGTPLLEKVKGKILEEGSNQNRISTRKGVIGGD